MPLLPVPVLRWARGAVVATATGAALLALQAPARALEPARLAPGEHIALDGSLDDAVWSRAAVTEIAWQFQPVPHKPAPVRTTVQAAVGEDALYFAIRAWDPQPARIRAPLTRRDRVQGDQDFVAIYLDTLGHGKSATFVRVNARGVIADGVYSADTQNEDTSPDFEVDAAARPLADGYSVELRIPYSALRFGREAAAHWQFLAVRSMPRDQTVRLANVDYSIDDASLLAHMEPLEGFRGPKDYAELLLRPSISVHQDRNQGDGAPSHRSNEVRPGLDAKWRASAEWVADLTIRPDFSQVELDVPQLLSNQQFALSLPEKRPFLLESTELFETPVLPQILGGTGERPVYTRTINALDSGLRATRRTEGSEATVLVVHDAGGGQVLLPHPYTTDTAIQAPSEVAVGRWRTTLGASTLGGIFTHRSYDDGSGVNDVAGPDWVWQATPSDQVHAEILGSHTTARDDGAGGLHRGAGQDSGFLYTDWNHNTENDFTFLGVEQIGRGFRADDGYIYESGMRRSTASASLKFHPDGDWTGVQPYLFYQATQAIADNAIVNSTAVPGVFLNGPHDLGVDFEIRPAMTQRVQALAPLHHFHQAFADVTAVPSSWFYAMELRATMGRKVDIANDRTAPGANWYVDTAFRGFTHYELGLHFEQDSVQGPAGGRALTDTLEQVLALAHLDAYHSLRAIWQHHTTQRTAELPTDVASSYARTDTLSLMAGWRPTAVRGLWVGVTHSQTSGTVPPLGTSLEVFAKFEWAFRR